MILGKQIKLMVLAIAAMAVCFWALSTETSARVAAAARPALAYFWLLIPLFVCCALITVVSLWFRPRPGRLWRRLSRVAAVLACTSLLALVVGGCPTGPASFSGFSVCRTCGAWLSESHSVLLPFMRTSSVAETRLSHFLEESGLVAEHEHDWVFGHGGGPCVTASGSGIELCDIAFDPLVPEILGAAARWDGPEEARRWLRMMVYGADHDVPVHVSVTGAWSSGAAADREEYERYRDSTLQSLDSLFAAFGVPNPRDGKPPD